MTLQKIADAVGVNVATAQRAIVNHPDFANANSEIITARGQLRPMHYAARARRDAEPTMIKKLIRVNPPRVRGRDVTRGSGKCVQLDTKLPTRARARRDALSECRPQPPGRALRCDCPCFRLVARLFPRRTAYSGLPLNGPVCVCAAPSTLATRARNSASSARNSAMSASPASVVAIAVWVIC